MTWHVLIDGEQKGPFEADTVKQMIGRGEVGAETLVWTAGIEDWSRAIDVPDEVLQQVLGPAEREALRQSGSAVLSVTVYGVK